MLMNLLRRRAEGICLFDEHLLTLGQASVDATDKENNWAKKPEDPAWGPVPHLLAEAT